MVNAGVWEATEGRGECELLFNIVVGESTVKYSDSSMEAIGRQNILNWLVANISWVYSVHNITMNIT
jgi:hypothetical protein